MSLKNCLSMSNLPFKAVLLASLVALTGNVLSEPDFAREQRLADEFVDAVMDGDVVDISDGQRDFKAIYTEADADVVKGTVVILHGRGFHPDWATVIQPLRVDLTTYGWNTLSIQMPVLNKAAKYNDYVPLFTDAMPRIEAAINYAREQSDGLLVLLAHSCGSHMAQHWVHQRGGNALASIDAFVGVGLGATDYKQPMVEPFVLDKMIMPVLDLYGETDFPAVLRMAPQRDKMMKVGGNPKSKQVMVPQAGHYFEGYSDELVEAVGSWLNTL